MCQRAEAGMYDADGHIAEVVTCGNGEVLGSNHGWDHD